MDDWEKLAMSTPATKKASKKTSKKTSKPAQAPKRQAAANGRARPVKTSKAPRPSKGSLLNFRVSRKDREIMARNAKTNKAKSLSAWIRSAALNYRPKA